jgi:ubiquinone/menaquinone biosynthesis C-methylase UbiE
MLDFACRRTASERANRFKWTVGDAATLPFPDGSFDLVFKSTLLCFCHNLAAVINEMARICRPGGVVLLGELNPRSPWQLWRRLKAAFGAGSFVGASWRKPDDLFALLTESGCQAQWLDRAIFWSPLNF